MRGALITLALVIVLWMIAVPSSHTIDEDDWACTEHQDQRLKFFPYFTRTACVQWSRKDRP